MAGASMKSIKLRIKSMESTRQITKAMELVAASKLRSAQNNAITSRPYFRELYEAMSDIYETSPEFASPYLKISSKGRSLYIVIAGDRGLAGGYNNNVLRMAAEKIREEDGVVLPIGKKAIEFFRHHGTEMLTDEYGKAAELTASDCFSIANVLAEDFRSGKFKAIVLAYTNFVSMLSQSPALLALLPMERQKGRGAVRRNILYEGGSEAVFDAIVPEYIGGLIYCALCESIASEQAARRTAMDSASKNADEIIGDLNLRFNRARQGAITQEITEIIAGSEQS